MNNPIQASPFYDYSTPLMNPQYANQGAAASRASGRDSFSGAARPAAARVAASPYTRPVEHLGPSSSVKASSTTSEFTKRKNWSQHIIDEIQDFMHVLSPTGNVMFSTPSIRDLTGWTSDEVTGRPIADFIHTDDVAGFLRDFESSLRDGHDLTLYYRFRMKDDRYTIFEITGHPYYAEENGQQQCKCFFAMGRPYPSKNTAMLDSFLELKTENERLRQELQVMYGEMEGTGPAIDYRPGASGSNNDYSQARQSSAAYTGFETSQSPYDQSHANLSPGPDMGGPSQAKAPMVSSMANYGASHSGPSAASVKAETAAEKKKKKIRVEEGEFVCRDCGTVESPEWRKGPDGPKSLCNACGLRFAKLKSKGDKLAKVIPKK